MKIVIIGAGFAGLKLARSLNNKGGFEVLLIDKNTLNVTLKNQSNATNNATIEHTTHTFW